MPESCPYVAKNKCNKVFFFNKKKMPKGQQDNEGQGPCVLALSGGCQWLGRGLLIRY
jgi:hypothetical protein